MPISGPDHEQLVTIPPPEKGRQIPVDLDQLIEAIYVSPASPASLYELVEKVCTRYSLSKPIYRSLTGGGTLILKSRTLASEAKLRRKRIQKDMSDRIAQARVFYLVYS